MGDNAEFTFKKILYVRDFILPEKNEHSLELFILGDVNVSDEIEGKGDPEFDGKKWPTWLSMDKLPDNLYPKPLTKKLIEDWKNDFPNVGEYVGRMDK